MKILIAPTALKGSLSAREAAQAMVAGLPPEATPIVCPVADGGDGLLECLVSGTNGAFFESTVRGPIGSLVVRARWGVLGDGSTAVIEMAEAAGLRLLSPREYDALHATTFGVGELVREAMKAGYRRILLGLGGSATNDGGMGFARALGIQFHNGQGRELPEGGIRLLELQNIDQRNANLLIEQTRFIGLADVDNPLVGPNGATRVFAPQKGASGADVEKLEQAMMRYATVLKNTTGTDVASIPRGGSAGGLGIALREFCRGELRSGIDFVLDMLRFDALLNTCDMVLTAEGMIDSQTAGGKAIAGIAARARTARKPVHAFAGRLGGTPAELTRTIGLTSVRAISPSDMSSSEAFSRASELMTESVQKFLEGRLRRFS
jgi:glycerate kinase